MAAAAQKLDAMRIVGSAPVQLGMPAIRFLPGGQARADASSVPERRSREHRSA
jgi:hypothetical protein